MFDQPVVVRGGGDLGSGVALRLLRAGFSVIVLECARPLAVRRTVAFGEAVYEGSHQVEGVAGQLCSSCKEVERTLQANEVPVLVDPAAQTLRQSQPFAVVDAILAKRNIGTNRSMAQVVVGLGPGFNAGDDVHAVVETNRGPDLGRVIWRGPAEANTGQPGIIGGKTSDRVLRAPTSGVLVSDREIGEIIQPGEVIARINEESVASPFKGVLRGLVRPGLEVERGSKIGDVDPRLDRTVCFRVSDKALAVAGGVLEAVLTVMNGTK